MSQQNFYSNNINLVGTSARSNTLAKTNSKKNLIESMASNIHISQNSPVMNFNSKTKYILGDQKYMPINNKN
jgi:hypothetical protein